MPYDFLIFAFLMLIFCFFMQMLTVKIVFSMLNASRKEGEREIKPVKLFEKPKKRPKMTEEQKKNARNDEILLHNYEVYDGTSYGQKDFE